jgi:hypothetical protein
MLLTVDESKAIGLQDGVHKSNGTRTLLRPGHGVLDIRPEVRTVCGVDRGLGEERAEGSLARVNILGRSPEPNTSFLNILRCKDGGGAGAVTDQTATCELVKRTDGIVGKAERMIQAELAASASV